MEEFCKTHASAVAGKSYEGTVAHDTNEVFRGTWLGTGKDKTYKSGQITGLRISKHEEKSTMSLRYLGSAGSTYQII